MVINALPAELFEVFEAESVEDAFRLASIYGQANLRLLIVDVVMPDMDGRDMAAWILRAYPKVRVLFISGFPNPKLADPKVLGPKAAFLAKPFTSQELLEKVQEMLAMTTVAAHA